MRPGGQARLSAVEGVRPGGQAQGPGNRPEAESEGGGRLHAVKDEGEAEASTPPA